MNNNREWIKYAEQKPEEDSEVFYFFEHCGIFRGKYFGRSTFGGESGFLTGDVTHWMPDDGGDLPGLPEGFQPRQRPNI